LGIESKQTVVDESTAWFFPQCANSHIIFDEFRHLHRATGGDTSENA